ncbi:MAG TPA: VIT1/CCC1 transporter family protein [Candidatus Saccharimonadales bacterium]
MKPIQREYLRSTIFGIEDSLVSTTGLIAGLSVGADSRRIVLLGGVVAIMVEAVSMGAGEYLSDDAVAELDKIKRHRDSPLVSGSIMLISYLLAGFLPLAPVIFISYPGSVWYSVILALVGLFLLGFLKGKLLHTSPFRGGLKILIVGGLATAFGLVVGSVFKLQ